MRRLLSLLLILSFLTGCAPKPQPIKRCSYNPDTEDVTEVVITYARDLRDSHELFLYNSLAYYDGDILKVRIDFTSQMSVELCEAREILYDVVEGYVERFRDHMNLRGAFANHPITYKDLEIHITFESYFNKFVDPAYMAYIILEKGTSFFYSSELNIDYTDKWLQKVEPYFKTRQFVRFSREAEEFHKNEEEEKTSLEEERFYIQGGVSTNSFFDR